jgi:hypothetical protein
MRRTSLLLLVAAATTVCAQTQTEPPAPATPGWEAAIKAATEACKGETPKLCPDLSTETAMACLQSNIDKLTPGCKDAVVKVAKSALNLN